MKIDAKSVDDYLAQIPTDRRDDLSRIRELILRKIPSSQETMDYGMPTYELDGENVISFASQKNYMSLYIMHTHLVEKYRDQLENVKPGKCCLRFTSLDKLPLPVIEDILEEMTA